MNMPLTPLPSHGGQLRQIAALYGVATGTLIDFSVNINPDGPPPSVLTAIQDALANPEVLTSYPDLELAELKKVIATSAKAQPENIVVANGFVPLLEAVLRALNTKRCLLPVPCFSEYRTTLENAKVVAIPYQVGSSGEFLYQPEAIMRAARNGACDTILLANPQNPSGALCQKEQMLRLLKMTAESEITLLLDEAFIDYCPDHSLTRYAIDQPHMVAFRSVTKFFAIPGLRVSYAVCNSSKAQTLNRFVAPWPITTLASHAVCAALVDKAYIEQSQRENGQRRLRMAQQLNTLNIKTYKSETNFLLLRLPANIDVGQLWERLIVEQQIVLRSCTNFEGLETGHLRAAVRSEGENKRLIAGLERVLSNA
jgi:threonine-phosphate decarboxylase